MTDIISREIQLVSRPKGMPTAANFAIAQTEIKPLQDGQILVRNLYLSVDPYMRGRMNESKSYVPSFELGKALEGGAVGEVIESRAEEFKPGDVVTSNFGWREYFTAAPTELHLVNREVQPLSVYLGAIGMTGMTAWAGLNLVDVKAGDVIFISGAAGGGKCGRTIGKIARMSCYRLSRFSGKSQVSARRMRIRSRFQLQFWPYPRPIEPSRTRRN